MASLIEQRHGLKETGDSEQFATSPFNISIVAPKPPRDLELKVTWEGHEYTFSAANIIGPNDKFEPGVGWDPTFDWFSIEENAKKLQSHVTQLLRGRDPKSIPCQHANKQAFPISIGGRHTIVVRRIANLILTDLGRKPANLSFRKRAYNEADAAVHSELDNRAYTRNPIEVLRARLYLIERNEWSDEDGGEHFGVSAITVRGWRKRVNDHDAGPGDSKPARKKRAKGKPLSSRDLKAAEERASELKGPIAAALTYAIRVMRTGQIPEGAPDEVRRAFERD
jgi:hypothetical protein